MRQSLRRVAMVLLLAIASAVFSSATPARADTVECEALFIKLDLLLDLEDAAFLRPEGPARDRQLVILERRIDEVVADLHANGCFDSDDPAPPALVELRELGEQVASYLRFLTNSGGPPASLRDGADAAVCILNVIAKYSLRGTVPLLSESCKRVIEGRIEERCSEIFVTSGARALCEFVLERAVV